MLLRATLATTAAGLCLGAAACSGHTGATATSARSSAPHCNVPHATRLMYDRYGALFAGRASTGERIYRACPAGGTPILIGRSRCLPLHGEPAVGAFRLAGRFLAYESDMCGVDTSQSTVNVLDMRRRRHVFTAPAVGPPAVPEGVQSLLALKVRSDGALAWVGTQRSLAGGRATRELWVADSHHRKTKFDAGGAIDPASLRLTSSSVSWRNGSTSHKASLR